MTKGFKRVRSVAFAGLFFSAIISAVSCSDMYGDMLDNAKNQFNIIILESTSMQTRLLMPDSNQNYFTNSSFNSLYSGSAVFGFSLFADFNNDSIIDILVIREGSVPPYYSEIWYPNANLEYSKTDLTLIDGSGLSDAAIADFDNNGYKDIVIVTGGGYNNKCFLNPSAGTGFSQFTFGTFIVKNSINTADFDNDGDIDLFIGTNSAGMDSSAVWLNNIKQTGAFQYSFPIETPVLTDSKTADFNNDGIPDIVIVNNGSYIQILLNNGNATFSSGWVSSSNYNSLRAAVGDLNGDGSFDIYVVNSTASSNLILLNDGHGNFSIKTHIEAGISYDASLADYDLDGDIDIFLAESTGLKIFNNDGHSNFYLSQTISPATGGPYNNIALGACIK